MLRYIIQKPTFNKRFYNTMSSSIKNINATQLSSFLKESQETMFSDIVLVDVRERHEIEEVGKIKGALNVPFRLDQIMFQAGLSDINKNYKTVFYCKSGRRSLEAAKIAESLGFQHVFNLEGGFSNWNGSTQAFMNNHSPWVHTLFDTDTETAQYVVTDLETREAFIVDPVLNYDPFSNKVHPLLANALLQFVEKYDLKVTKIIDTHVHADHLTAASYLKKHLSTKPEFWIGSNVTKVQSVFGYTYNLDEIELDTTGKQFDKLVDESMTWTLGKNIHCSVLSTPGHTPACMSYRIGDAAFVGDTLFMPDIGTARCDFPGGSIKEMYESVQKMYSTWPDDTRVFIGHDYPPTDRPYTVETSIEKQKKFNKMIHSSVSLEEYEKVRRERDSKLRAPRYIHPSIQTNLRGGILPTPETPVHNDDKPRQFFKIPIRMTN